MQGEPSPAAVSLFVPVTLIVPLPRSVATHAQWAPLVSIVMFWAVMTPAYVASRPRDEFLVVAIVSVSDPPLTTRKTFWSAVVLAHVPPSMVAAMPSTRYAPDSFCVPPPPPGPDWLDENVAEYVPAESFVL